MKVRSLKLSRELEQALREHAREKGVTDSFVMREAIAEYLATPARVSSVRSAADAAAHLIGSLDGTPADLSTNPKHLKGFGK
jgi:predicted transcriptional regulator